MSETPTGPPPPQFVAYPRYHHVYGTPEKLQALSDGYFGLNLVFLTMVACWCGALALFVFSQGSPEVLVGAGLIGLCLIGWASYRPSKNIATGMGWSHSTAVIASVLISLNSVICWGLIGLSVMQSLALGEISRYGIKPGFMGLRKKDVTQAVRDLRAQLDNPAPFIPPPHLP